MKERDQEIRGTTLVDYDENSFEVHLSDGAMAMVNELIHHSQGTPSELFMKALVLYKVAMDAKAEGNHIAIVNAKGELEQDIAGL